MLKRLLQYQFVCEYQKFNEGNYIVRFRKLELTFFARMFKYVIYYGFVRLYWQEQSCTGLVLFSRKS